MPSRDSITLSFTVLLASLLVWDCALVQAATPDLSCQSKKLKEASSYSKCRLKAESKAALKSVAPDFSRCDSKLILKWDKIDTQFGGACPTLESTEGDRTFSSNILTFASDAIATCLATAVCIPADPAALGCPATGQLTSYPADKNGAPAQAVQDDGALQLGAALSFTDNGDGTITDLNTGCMWEKKIQWNVSANFAELHDADNVYFWSTAAGDSVWDWLDAVNAEGGTGFAGHNDWRIPNVKELVSIVDYGRFDPSIDPAFSGASCGVACADITDPACSCTSRSCQWTSTTQDRDSAMAWCVKFDDGLVTPTPKTGTTDRVRAVRGCSP